MRVVTCKMYLFSLYFVKYMIFIIHEMLFGRIGVTFGYNFALRKYDYRGRWSTTLKKIGGGQGKLMGGEL